jgi:uncharacterized membrane protein
MSDITLGLGLCAGLYIVAGVLHFVIPKFYLRMMPPWIPAHRFCVYASGVAEIIVGAGLLVEVTRPWAAWGVIALLIAVFPANLYMFQTPEKFKDVPRWALVLRLPAQAALIYWAWLYTAPAVA